MQQDSHQMIFKKLYPNSYSPYLLKKMDIIIGFFLFFVSMVVYLKTLTPSVTSGDSGELITTVYNMGASHPPGYPLYGIIGKLFTFLRFADIGYKMNIFSAISASTAVFFAYIILVKLLGFNKKVDFFSSSVHIPAIAATFVFAFSKAHWSQAVIAEVYALNVALSGVLFFVMILWYEELVVYRDDPHCFWLAPRATFLLAFVMGLSITNHQIPIWYVITWAIMLFPIMFMMVSYKGVEFREQFEGRWVPVFLFISVCVMAVMLFIISALKPYVLFPKVVMQGEYRWILPMHVPYILTSILCLPIWSTCYVIQNHIYRLKSHSSVDKVLLQIVHVFYMLMVLVILGVSFLFLESHSVVICLPLIMSTVYQFVQQKEIHKKNSNNWVDQFLLIFTIAMWFFVFAVSIYLYLWIRAKALAPLTDPKPFAWGDVQTLDILINHMLRVQYPLGVRDYSNLPGQLWSLVMYHVEQFGWINVILGLFGMGCFLKKEPVQGSYFVLSSFIYLWCIVRFINFQVESRSLEVQEVFFIQQFLIYVFFIGFAYQRMFDLHRDFFYCRKKKV